MWLKQSQITKYATMDRADVHSKIICDAFIVSLKQELGVRYLESGFAQVHVG